MRSAGRGSSSAGATSSISRSIPTRPSSTTTRPCRPKARRPRISAPCARSEEHTSELQSLMRISYAVFCLKKKKKKQNKIEKHPRRHLYSDKRQKETNHTKRENPT